MVKKIYTPVFLFLFLACSKVNAGEIVGENKTGSLILHSNGRQVVYENIIGGKEGFERRLIEINGFPALQVMARYNFYYTLVIREGGVLIDCAYFDARNTYNGARASAGMCGLNVQLSEVYDEIAQEYSNEWRASIFSFDTSPVFEKGRATNFLLGKIGGVEIYDRYLSAEALENASPQKYIKSASGCFNFGDAVGFLVFLNDDKRQLKYLDVLQSVEPMKLQRMQERDLKNLAVDKCM
jgi:hypothetical protein